MLYSPSTLAVVTGANSQIATSYMDYFAKQQYDILATFQNKPIESTKYIIPVGCNLQDTWDTEMAMRKDFDSLGKTINTYKRILFLHLVGGFAYEGMTIDQKVLQDTFMSNIVSFRNMYNAIVSRFSEMPEVTLFNIGSLSDVCVGSTPRHSYSIVKNMLREQFKKEVGFHPDRMNALFVNAGTIDMDKERQLRPYADQAYRLSREELFEQTIHDLETAKGYKEVELYKAHPLHEEKYAHENLEDTHARWLQEMGKNA